MASMADICYRYDGSLDGLLCCIFQSYKRDEIPAIIEGEDSAQINLFPVLRIESSKELARRVSIAIHQKISPEALHLVRLSHLTCLEERESHILRFVRFGFRVGANATRLMADPRVEVLLKATHHLEFEQQRYKQFVRFSDLDGVLVAEIEPKNYVLPLIATHFADRYPQEIFLIYDRTHRMALLCGKGQKELVAVDNLTIPPASLEERQYRRLWKRFYDAVAVESRINPRCRMNMMPKRYWGVMTEFLEKGEPLHPAALPAGRV